MLRPALANAMMCSLYSAGYGVFVLGMKTSCSTDQNLSIEPGNSTSAVILRKVRRRLF